MVWLPGLVAAGVVDQSSMFLCHSDHCLLVDCLSPAACESSGHSASSPALGDIIPGEMGAGGARLCALVPLLCIDFLLMTHYREHPSTSLSHICLSFLVKFLLKSCPCFVELFVFLSLSLKGYLYIF